MLVAECLRLQNILDTFGGSHVRCPADRSGGSIDSVPSCEIVSRLAPLAACRQLTSSGVGA
ncbi:hypothetical protein AXA44_45235 [Rhodococcus sp. SC4]|nr:hypothetical protein AXA44_45235 [Rhodococcus sp. SC4]